MTEQHLCPPPKNLCDHMQKLTRTCLHLRNQYRRLVREKASLHECHTSVDREIEKFTKKNRRSKGQSLWKIALIKRKKFYDILTTSA